jgi:hypothetical protein
MKGDRNDFEQVRSQLSGSGFDVVYDINGREADQVHPILDALPDLEQYIYCSSAGVYLKSYQMPHRCATNFGEACCLLTTSFSNAVLWLEHSYGIVHISDHHSG